MMGAVYMPRSIYFHILKHLAYSDASVSKLSVANALNLKPSVVIRAINKLKDKGYIHVERRYKGRRAADACRITVRGLCYLIEKNQIAPQECFKALFKSVDLVKSTLSKMLDSPSEETPPEVNSEIQALLGMFFYLSRSPDSFKNMGGSLEEQKRILSGIIEFYKVIKQWFVKGTTIIDNLLNQLESYYANM
jgi:DNA-binding Lrp family transcriptional regulator